MKEFELLSKQQNKAFNAKNNIILLTFDSGYYKQAINLMMSANRYNDNISFICLCSELTPEVAAEVLNEEYGLGVLLCQYKINFHITEIRWSDVTTFRAFVPWLIDDPDITDVLYLDADMLVKGDLSPLFDIKDYFLVMATEVSGNVLSRNDATGTNIYCNAGMAKINLVAFREEYEIDKYKNDFFEAVKNYDFLDQDFLNFYIDKKKITIVNGFIYNFQPYELLNTMWFSAALNNCRIIHFSWQRPWDINCKFLEYFDIYLRNSFYVPMIYLINQIKIDRLERDYEKIVDEILKI